jgi:flagellin
MSLTINTNAAAVTASYNLSRNNASLQKSLSRLSSGRRIVQTSDDAGGLAVSMKLNASINRMQGVSNNIQNATSYLDVQDGILQGAAGIVSRMAELKSLSQDVLKNESDIANYNTEFKNLQVQLYQISQDTFNGVSLFATTTTDGTTGAIFGGGSSKDNTVSIYTTERGSSGPIVSLNKAVLLSAITFSKTDVSTNVSFATAKTSAIHLATTESTNALVLDDIAVSFFTQAIENIATLRAENGGTVSRFNFAFEQANRTKATLEAANGRIMDVDIATESTRLAKYNILVQASASMLAQANTTPNAALMLLG